MTWVARSWMEYCRLVYSCSFINNFLAASGCGQWEWAVWQCSWCFPLCCVEYLYLYACRVQTLSEMIHDLQQQTFFSANENILRGVFWLQSVQCLLPPTGLSAALYTDNGCPGPGWLQARLGEMANIYTQIQFPAKLDSRMCSRHEYPRLEMRLFKFPLAPSLSAGMETQGLKTLVRLWGLENDPRLFREFIVRLILVYHLWCSVLTGPNILTSAPL